MAAPSGPTPQGGLPPPPTGGRRRRGLRTAIVAVCAAALVVGALFATGVVHLGSAAPNPAIPFSQARADAEGATAKALGGPWVAVAAIGLDVRVLTSVPTNLSGLLGTGCTVTALAGVTLPTQLLVPAYSGSYGSGLSPFWIVLVANTTSKEVVLVEVVDRQATALAQLGGSGCPVSGSSSDVLSSSTVDSPQVAGLAWTAAGQEFVTLDPNLTVLVLAAFGGGFRYAGVSLGSVWGIAYAPCDPFLGGTVSEKADVAALNLTTGGLLAFYSNVPVSCPA